MVLRDERALPAPGDARGQPTVLGRIDEVDAAAEDGDRAPPGAQGRLVGACVDPLRQPADDRQPGPRQLPGEAGRHLAAVARHPARPDDAEREVVRRGELAAHVEDRRRTRDLPQPRWVARIVPGEEGDPGPLDARDLAVEIDPPLRRRQVRPQPLAEPGALELP